jgi:Flp pilus assembly protein TadG
MHHFIRKPETHPRRGAVAVLAAVMMITLVGMLAFAIDLSYLANSRAELQRTADASALAGCYQLMYTGTPGSPVNLSSNVANVPAAAAQYASANPVCNSGPALGSSDVTAGFLANPTTSGGSLNATANVNNFNAVQVTVHRSASENGKVPTFFGSVFGANGESASATATAAFISNFGGFKIPSTSSGSGGLMLLPFALDKQTWDALQAGDTTVTTDSWKYSAGSGVTAGSDGIREVNLFPQGTGSPGNRGTVNIGASNNSTSTLVRQILTGISAADLAYYPNGQLTFNDSGHLYLNADPGISAGCKSALQSIIGQTRIIPIFASISGNGNNATYDIVQFVGVRILDVDLTGSMSSKHLTVQPAVVYTRGGIPATTTSTQFSYGIYSPICLVK